jgi:hypothetical protein
MPDLPSGTVTFLFTDIEGSTALWARVRAAMAAAEAREFALLDAARGSRRHRPVLPLDITRRGLSQTGVK